MKRDMDLVRKILLHVEENEDGNISLAIPGYSQDEIYRHVELMKDKDLVDAAIVLAGDGAGHEILTCEVRRLTGAGHDFLDAVRSDTVWEQVKKLCLERTGGLTIELLMECLIRLGKQTLGMEE